MAIARLTIYFIVILYRHKKRKPSATSTIAEKTDLKKPMLVTHAGADGTKTKAAVPAQPASTGDGRARFIAYTGADVAVMGMNA